MTQQLIDLDTAQPGGKKGDPLRSAFGKANDNFTELYESSEEHGSGLATALATATEALGIGNSAQTAAESAATAEGTAVTPAPWLSETNAQEALARIAAGQFGGLRNRIINPVFSMGQRGVSFTNVNGYTLDRWRVAKATATGQIDAQLVTLEDNLPDGMPASSLGIQVTVADTTTTANKLYVIEQKIEGANVADLIGKPFYIAFDVISSVPGRYYVSMRNSQSDRSYLMAYDISAAEVWEHKVLKVPNGLITAGTWNWTSGIGITLDWVLDIGTTYAGSAADSWLTGNYLARSDQAKWMATIGNWLELTNVCLAPGTEEEPFELRQRAIEYALCQRYYEIVGTIATADGPTYDCVYFKVQKRATPTLTQIGGGSMSPATFQSRDAGYFNIFNRAAAAVAITVGADAEL